MNGIDGIAGISIWADGYAAKHWGQRLLGLPSRLGANRVLWQKAIQHSMNFTSLIACRHQ